MKQLLTTIAIVFAALILTGCEPKDERPGLWLSAGDSTEAFTGWQFAENVDEIFIETYPWYGLPHSTTIWSVVLDSRLYIGSYGSDKKSWEKNIARNTEARLEIANQLYAVNVVPVEAPLLSQQVETAYFKKYDMAEVFGDDIPKWWFYSVTLRPAE
jgi:hypothetical protein